MDFTTSQLPTKKALKVWAIDLSITFYELICDVNEVNFNIIFISDKKDTWNSNLLIGVYWDT